MMRHHNTPLLLSRLLSSSSQIPLRRRVRLLFAIALLAFHCGFSEPSQVSDFDNMAHLSGSASDRLVSPGNHAVDGGFPPGSVSVDPGPLKAGASGSGSGAGKSNSGAAPLSSGAGPVAGTAKQSLGGGAGPGKDDASPATGGGFSKNGGFSYGYASSPGKRSSMEDFYETRIDGVNGEIVGLFGVFDGHGGVRAAEYVKQHLFSNLISHPKFISDTKSAIVDAYNHTDSEFLKSDNNQNRDAGSTASTAILVGDRLLVANVGDSRVVICRGGNAIAVSRDHKPDQTDERQRIEDAGGFVMWAGTWRVGGVLAVSRAFGDKLLKEFVVADPDIREEVVDSSLEFLILASDGLWDVVSNEEAVSMVKPINDPEKAAQRLLQEASHRGSADNITCLVVRFLAASVCEAQ